MHDYLDGIDYSRAAFDEANRLYSRHEYNAPRIAGNYYRKVKDLLAVAQLEANHEYAYRLAGRVEPIDNPAF